MQIFNRQRVMTFAAMVALMATASSAQVFAQDVPGKAPAERLVLPEVTPRRPAAAPVPLAPPALAPAGGAPAVRLRAAIQIQGAIQAARAAESPSQSTPPGTALNISEDLERLLEKATQVAAERPDLA
ncbi:MAG TPA: hypothetical protein VM510_12685, partial [Caulifigura sp.]|nr:hypothetical protein [Caulifigura sp.]